MNEYERLHRVLDGQDEERPAPGSPEAVRLAAYEEALSQLVECAEPAPVTLLSRVLAALPENPEPSWRGRLRSLWPDLPRWAAPAMAGALVALVLSLGIGTWLRPIADNRIAVTFEIRAPGARQVDLVGSFNAWQPGQITLEGPDATGYWTATVQLPAGRHEYLFLVDGQDWVTDPQAAIHRPDGFGRENALLEL